MPTDCGEIRLFLSRNNLHTGSINSNKKKLERSETLILRKRLLTGNVYIQLLT